MNNFLCKLYNTKIIDNFCRFLIYVFSIILIILAVGKTSYPIGESSCYMLTTISLENRFSLTILPEDVEEAVVSFPEHAKSIRDCYDNSRLPKGSDGEFHPWYFGTYSFSCIPAKVFLSFLNISKSNAFALTNALFYIITLIVIYKKLKVSQINKLLILLLFMINPAIYYIVWPSAEIFIFSFATMSIVFFTNKEYKKAGLLISIAGSLNSTIMIVGIVIIIDYFFNMYKNNNKQGNIFKIFIHNFRDIFLFGLSFIISLMPLVYNYIYFKTFSLQSLVGFLGVKNLGGRFFSYLFDLNYGILPYFPLIFILFIIISSYGLFKRDIEAILYIIAFYGTIAVFSIMFHINCGMSGIARYNLWISPVAIIYVITYIDKKIINKKIKVICNSAIIFSLILSFIIIIVSSNSCYVFMSPLAKLILEKYPEIYNPYPYTFVSRVDHVDGGYYYNKPVIYNNDEGYVRKILVTPETVEQVYNLVYASENESDYINLKNQVEKIKLKKGFQYISLGYNTKIKNLPLTYELNPSVGLENTDIVSGIYADEGEYVWINNDAILNLKKDPNKNKIKIDFEVNELLFSANPNKKINLEIMINDQLIKVVEIKEVGRQKIYIDSDEIPKFNSQSYKIQLMTNAYFNPFAMGISSDNRNLSIALFYIGQQ